MKKLILFFAFCVISLCGFAQRPQFMQFPNMSQYEVVDSLPLERILIHFNNDEIDDENLISLGGGDYMAIAPHKDKMIIKTNKDRTKAIVVYNSYVFGRHLEFEIQENDRRIVLYTKDKNTYCGYIYDKEFKICKFFEDKKEFKRFMRRPMFNRIMFRP